MELTRSSPSNALYWFNLGNVEFNLGDFRSALASHEEVARLMSPLSLASQFIQAKCHRKLFEFEKAANLLLKFKGAPLSDEMQSEIGEELATLENEVIEKGLQFYKEGDYQEAIDYLEIAEKMGGEEQLTMVKALALFNLQRKEEAVELLTKVATRSVTPSTKQGAGFLLEGMEFADRKKPYWIFLDLSSGYNSNVNQDGRSRTKIQTGVIDLYTGGGYEFPRRGNFFSKAGVALFLEEVPSHSSSRLLIDNIYFQEQYYDSDWLVRVSPYFQHQLLDTYTLLFKVGATLKVQREWNDLSVGLNFDLGKNFGIESYNYLSGGYKGVRPTIGVDLDSLHAEFFYRYTLEETGDLVRGGSLLPLANHSHGPGSTLHWEISPAWDITFSIGYYWKIFKTLALPDVAERKDTTIESFLKISRKMNSSLGLFAQFGFLRNRSTLGAGSVHDRNFDRYVTLFGASWDILK